MTSPLPHSLHRLFRDRFINLFHQVSPSITTMCGALLIQSPYPLELEEALLHPT